jgi:hypothetical protein
MKWNTMPSQAVRVADRARVARRTRPVIEDLESRSLLTGNLWIMGARLVDASEQPIVEPAIGEEVIVEAQCRAAACRSPTDTRCSSRWIRGCAFTGRG